MARGWFRLWVVLSAIGVPAFAIWMFNDDAATWRAIHKPMYNICLDQEANLPSHPDALKCIHDAGADNTVFEDEKISPRDYWARALGLAFVVDFVLTGIIVGAFVVIRWIVRGFKDAPGT